MIELNISGNEELPKKLRVLVAGNAGSGKTTLATRFPNPIWAEANSGITTIARIGGVPYARIETETDLFSIKESLDAGLIQDSIGEINTLVVDSIDEVQRRLLMYRLKTQGRTETKIDDYGWLNLRMEAILNGLNQLDLHIVYISHLQEIYLDGGEAILKPALQGQFKDRIHDFVDMSLLLQARSVPNVKPEVVEIIPEGNQISFDQLVEEKVVRSFLTTRPTRLCDWVNDKTDRLPVEIENDESVFDVLVSALNFEGMKESSSIKIEEPVDSSADGEQVEIEDGTHTLCEECGAEVPPSEPWADLAQMKFGKAYCATHYKEKA